MGGTSVTVSLRKDEREAIDKLIAEANVKRHHIIKLALRRFLFPAERSMSLNGVKAEISEEINLLPHHRNITFTKDSDKKITIIKGKRENY